MYKDIKFDGFADFNFKIKYSELYRETHFFQIDAHVHSECEIYINLSGDIAFMVGDEIYDVKRGDAVIVSPNEYHHCIYKSDALHKHFWILIQVNGNEHILKPFFDKNEGSGALTVLSASEKDELISVCFSLCEDELDKFERYILFFKLLKLLKAGRRNVRKYRENDLPNDMIFAIDYINKHLPQNISISDISKAAFVSINTLERHFREKLNMSPTAFIKDKRLVYAAKLLREGKSVLDAAMESGFCDSSYFIVCFKEKFNLTPFAYRKKNMKE